VSLGLAETDPAGHAVQVALLLEISLSGEVVYSTRAVPPDGTRVTFAPGPAGNGRLVPKGKVETVTVSAQARAVQKARSSETRNRFTGTPEITANIFSCRARL